MWSGRSGDLEHDTRETRWRWSPKSHGDVVDEVGEPRTKVRPGQNIGYPRGVVGNGSSGAHSEGFTSRAAIGYDHGYDGEIFYLGLALDPRYVEGFVEGCLERIGEDAPEEERMFRDLWDDPGEREVVLASLKADCDVRPGRGPY